MRDEADIVEAHLSFQLNAGVDFVIATDHRSQDGTREVLEAFARQGHLMLMSQDERQFEQSTWVTRMARLAATEYHADWVINSDADEFWWPRARTLKEVLAAVPERYGVVYAPICNFPPQRGDGPFYELMTVRVAQHAPLNNPLGRYRPSMKAAHRGSPSVVVHRGNHEVDRAGERLRSWHPFEVLHFPDRSPEQAARKYANMVAAWPVGGREPGAFVVAAHNAMERRGVETAFGRLALTEDDLSRSSDYGVLARDTRLRDVLRRLVHRLENQVSREPLRPPTPLDNARHAVESSALVEADLIRIHRDVDDLRRRVMKIERRREPRRTRGKR